MYVWHIFIHIDKRIDTYISYIYIDIDIGV